MTSSMAYPLCLPPPPPSSNPPPHTHTHIQIHTHTHTHTLTDEKILIFAGIIKHDRLVVPEFRNAVP